MDRAAAIAAEALVFLARVYPSDEPFVAAVREMLNHMDRIWEEAQKEKHRVHQLKKESERSSSPCPCGDCNEDDAEDLKDALRAAFLADVNGETE